MTYYIVNYLLIKAMFIVLRFWQLLNISINFPFQINNYNLFYQTGKNWGHSIQPNVSLTSIKIIRRQLPCHFLQMLMIKHDKTTKPYLKQNKNNKCSLCVLLEEAASTTQPLQVRASGRSNSPISKPQTLFKLKLYRPITDDHYSSETKRQPLMLKAKLGSGLFRAHSLSNCWPYCWLGNNAFWLL